MRIGIDFDNTIANYDRVFHAAALERGLIPEGIPDTSKNAVRDLLNGSGRNQDFTKLQGYVYGARMDLVALYDGVAVFIAAAVKAGHDIFVVSHKTRTPITGPAYDMHASAREFLKSQGIVGKHFVKPEHVFFEVTKEEKVARITSLDLDVFIDDLPEILTMEGFPPTVRRILFDPMNALASRSGSLERLTEWPSIQNALID